MDSALKKKNDSDSEEEKAPPHTLVSSPTVDVARQLSVVSSEVHDLKSEEAANKLDDSVSKKEKKSLKKERKREEHEKKALQKELTHAVEDDVGTHHHLLPFLHKKEKAADREKLKEAGDELAQQKGVTPHAAYTATHKKDRPTVSSHKALFRDKVEAYREEKLHPKTGEGTDTADVLETGTGVGEVRERAEIPGASQDLGAIEEVGGAANMMGGLIHAKKAFQAHHEKGGDEAQQALRHDEVKEHTKEAVSQTGRGAVQIVTGAGHIIKEAHPVIAETLGQVVAPIGATLSIAEGISKSRDVAHQAHNYEAMHHAQKEAVASESEMKYPAQNLAHHAVQKGAEDVVDATTSFLSGGASIANMVPTPVTTGLKAATSVLTGGTKLGETIIHEGSQMRNEHDERVAERGGEGSTEAKKSLVKHDHTLAVDGVLMALEQGSSDDQQIAKGALAQIGITEEMLASPNLRELIAERLDVHLDRVSLFDQFKHKMHSLKEKAHQLLHHGEKKDADKKDKQEKDS